ncbi:MAG: response regulator transcription factor [Verrucomicrobiota bacterium]
MSKVLIVEDEEDILDLITFNLERADCTVLRALDGNDGERLAKEAIPDVIVMDLMLPGKDGLTLFKELKEDSRTKDIPVLMLTAKAELTDKITGLKLGADDYVTKPFSPRELVLRVQALLRRTKAVPKGTQSTVGPFFLDKSSLKCYCDGEELELTSTEYKLLSILLDHPGEIQSRTALLRDVWGYKDNVHTRTLDTHMKRLREKLGSHASHVETVRGSGYRFVVEAKMPKSAKV